MTSYLFKSEKERLVSNITHVSEKLFECLFVSHQNNQELVIKHNHGGLTRKLKPEKGEVKSVVVYRKGVNASSDSSGTNPGLETLGIAFEVALRVVRSHSLKKRQVATVFKPVVR